MTARRSPDALAFTGFSDETLAFFEGLEADNSKAYWQDHREVWERAVRDPMTALLASLEAEFGPARQFRPYRDVRFSADKSPYKTHQGAVITATGGPAAWYVQVSATGLVVGGGLMGLARDQLERYRAAVDAVRSGERLDQVYRLLTGQGWQVIGETLARAPRGFSPDHPRAALLRHKSIALTQDHGDPEWFTTAACRDAVAAGWRTLTPFLAWFAQHVGPSDLPGRGAGAG